MFGFSSLNLARLSDKQLWPWDSFLKGLLALSLHPWKNGEKWKMWETWVCFQGLSFMLKVVIEKCFQITDVWNVESSNFCYGKNFLYWRNISEVKNSFVSLSSQTSKPLCVLCSSLKWSSCGWTGAGCSSLGRTEQTCPNWALFAVPLAGVSHISSRCSALFQLLKAWAFSTSQPWLCLQW